MKSPCEKPTPKAWPASTLMPFTDRRNVIAGRRRAGAQISFHSALANGEFVQCCGRESMCPGSLAGHLPGIVQCGELRHGRGGTSLQQRPEDAGVNTIVLKLFVDTAEILCSVADRGAAKRTGILHRRVTRNGIGRCGSTKAASTGKSEIGIRILDIRNGHIG